MGRVVCCLVPLLLIGCDFTPQDCDQIDALVLGHSNAGLFGDETTDRWGQSPGGDRLDAHTEFWKIVNNDQRDSRLVGWLVALLAVLVAVLVAAVILGVVW